MLTNDLPLPHLSDVHREAMNIGSAGAPLFAVLHTAGDIPPRNCVAVICPPVGHEYVHSHRSVRHLADALARSGVQALRLDYQGTGDSPGADSDADRLVSWTQSVLVAIREVRNLAPSVPVCLIGIRLGAALAAMAASHIEVDWLVEWFPVVSGRRYLREQTAVAHSRQGGRRASGAMLEAAGFLVTQQTQNEIRGIDLLSVSAKVKMGALLIWRDDLEENSELQKFMEAQGITVNSVKCPGYSEMVAQPLYARVPQDAIDTTVGWLQAKTAARSGPYQCTSYPTEMTYEFTTTENHRAILADTICRFGEGGRLFGIHSRPKIPDPKLPTVVFFSAGVVHRIGPGGLYTLLARNLASLGFSCFRFDLEGIGDSVRSDAGRENFPYPENATHNAEAALTFLRDRLDCRNFILIGLCSGAYTSFMSGLALRDHSISEVVLINPLTFHWKEGDILDAGHYRNVAYYRTSMYRLASWRKLLEGRVNVLNITRVMALHVVAQMKSRMRSLAERIYPKAGTELANKLRILFRQGRRMSVFIASGESGWDLLLGGARHAVRQGMKRGMLSYHFIADSDHTFSNEDGKIRMVNSLRTHLKQYLDDRARLPIRKGMDLPAGTGSQPR